MKRIISFITAIVMAALAAYAVYGDNIDESSTADSAESQEAVSEEEKIPPRYYRHVSEFGEIKGEEIRTDKNIYILYLDSDSVSVDMNAEVMPVNATDKKLAFSSSDESIVTVSSDGKIMAAGKTGEATVYISSETLYKECRIEVRRAVKGISLSSSDLSFYADRPTTARLTANVIPSDATNKNVKWKSSDTSIAGVDNEGNVSTCGVGTATITAVTEDGGFKAQCTVRSTVYDITVKGVFITNPVEAIPVGTEYSLTSMIYPESARNKTVSWSTSDSNIISIDGNGILHANSEGYATISLTAENGMEDYFTLAAVTLNEGEQFEYVSTAVPIDERIAQLAVPVYYESYQSSYDNALRTQLKKSPVVFTTNSRAASQAEVEQYLNPSNSMKGYAKYQFLDLSSVSEVSARMLNVYLSDKGILKDKGEVFQAAAEESHVNAAYLAVHACLESGGGKSELACGVEYNGTTVYNLFGIGAYDDDPVNGGAKYAYEKGWTSIDAAIRGGADWISRSYINSGQNTLYKMRWNPSKPGQNQYATDVGWASKQARTLQAFMEVFPISSLVFDVPVYAGQERPAMKYE